MHVWGFRIPRRAGTIRVSLEQMGWGATMNAVIGVATRLGGAGMVFLAGVLAILLVAGGLGASAQAHAIIEHSVPEPHGVVAGPDVDIQLHYNSRIDMARSRLSLTRPDGTQIPLAIKKQSNDPALLAAQATGLSDGAYVLHWQALAVDGHLTRGAVPFTVGTRPNP